jgi:hypothetical protein
MDARSFLLRDTLYSVFPSPVACLRQLQVLEKVPEA